jgi:general secretion pathway protein G
MNPKSLKNNSSRSALRRSNRRRSGESAFTLVELLLVLVILGILAAIVVPKFSGKTEMAQRTAAATNIATFATALSNFEIDTGSYPRGSDGLQQLLVQPADIANWHGPYLDRDIPKDPWGNDYVYEYPGRINPSGYDIISMGPDKQPGTQDDIVNAGITAK